MIHIVGTNGKGSTGRFLASLLYQANKNVLHYSSPHILKFNERIWINSQDAADQELENTHQKLLKLLDKEYIQKLTYFEYTTLLALYLSSEMDYLVLEAGLGGEYDATNVVTNDLSIFTPIGYDHQSFLGESIEEIAATKMKSCDNSFITAKQRYNTVYEVQKDILNEKQEIKLQELELNDEVQMLPKYLQENFNTALNVLQYLNIDLKRYTLPKLFGRFESLSENIIIDVGHNSLAATALAEQLKRHDTKFILIYNSFKDKDYESVLKTLKPYIKEVQIIQCDDNRIVAREKLDRCIKDLSLNSTSFDIIKLNKNNYYLVFGSFSVVEAFLKEYNIYER